MKIKFLGTGAAEGVPAMFCDCDICKKIRAGEGEKRTRSQVLIDGELSVDFPPDAFANCLRHGAEPGKIKYIFATHSHMDHFYAHDFILRGYKYAKLCVPSLDIFGNGEVMKVFGECTAREMKADVAIGINLHEIKTGTVYYAGYYKIIPFAAEHSATEECFLYYIERDGKGYIHFYDTGKIKENSLEVLKNNGAKAQLVAFDCTFGDTLKPESCRHMSIYDNLLMKEKLEQYGIIDSNTKIIITHFSHNCNPTHEHIARIEREFGVSAAYDGMEIEI